MTSSVNEAFEIQGKGFLKKFEKWLLLFPFNFKNKIVAAIIEFKYVTWRNKDYFLNKD